MSSFGLHKLLAGNTLAMADYSTPGSVTQNNRLNDTTKSGHSSNPKRFKKFFKRSPMLPIIVILVFVAGIAVFSVSSVMNAEPGSASAVLGNDKRVEIGKPIAQQTLNKNFDFPLTDAEGKEVSKLKFEIQDAELRNEIIVKGQRATSVKGRVFLILNIKITNTYNQSLELNSRDYVRLVVGGSPEKLAADIHNDPVEVQAISTKYTRLGFPIDEGQKDLTLQVGEINGEKQTIKLDLR